MDQTPRTRKHRNARKPWSKTDTDKLIRLYPKNHNDELVRIFRRTAGAINAQAGRLGLKRVYDDNFKREEQEPRRWSERDKKTLEKIYHKHTLEELGEIFGRRATAIASQAHKQRIKKITWTEKQLNFLRKNYKTMKLAKLGKVIGKTEDAVQLRLGRLGLKKNEQYYWTPEDEAKLKKMYTKASLEELTKEFGRTKIALKIRARKIDAPKKCILWSKEDSDYLARNYSRMPPAQIAQKLNKTVDAVTAKAHILGIKNVRYLTEKEIAYIKRWFHKKSIEEIAAALGRCVDTVRQYAREMELSKLRGWTQKEIDKLKQLYKKGVPISDIAKRLGRTCKATDAKLTKIGLDRRRTIRRMYNAVGTNSIGTLKKLTLMVISELRFPSTFRRKIFNMSFLIFSDDNGKAQRLSSGV